jgi:subtilase family serine protease
MQVHTRIPKLNFARFATWLAFTVLLVCANQTQSQTPASAAPLALKGLTPRQLSDGSAKLVGQYPTTNHLRLVIGLQRPHMAEEEEFLKELQTKGSPNFQKYLTAAEWISRFGPSAADEQAVVDWATSQGLTVSKRYPNRLLVDIDAPVDAIQKAFGVAINSYAVGTRSAFSNDRDPVIPASLANIVHSIGGLNNVAVMRPSSKGLHEPNFPDYSEGPSVASGIEGKASAEAERPISRQGIHPDITGGAYDPTDLYSSQAYDLNALYNQGHCCNPLNNSGITPPESSIAIATAGSQDGNDLDGFHTAYPYLAIHYQQFNIDGTPSCCDAVGTMAFDWATAWSNSFGGYTNTAMIYLYDGANSNVGTFTDVYNQILSDQKAKVFSTGWECEEAACIPYSIMESDHGIFNSMVGQGMTLVAGTGGQGATAGCGDADAVNYPGSDPDIVGVGGTTLNLFPGGNFVSEDAWTGGPGNCANEDGGSTGGVSAYFSAPDYQSNQTVGARYVPDIALNADWYNSPQNYYFGGVLQAGGGTTMAAPSVAGFFAQMNAYLDFVGTQVGTCNDGEACAPIGNGNYYLYWFGNNPGYAPHYPFYDVTQGCNNNDITADFGLVYYCAQAGYDQVTGWGSFNALQLARAITTYRAYFGNPSASFTGFTQPTINYWYNTDQQVQWSISETTNDSYPSTGMAGYTADWDTDISDSASEATPGSGDSFYAGVEYPNSTTGGIYVSAAGQGCHTVNVRSWDNAGATAENSYGPVCYDTVAPVTTVALNGTLSGGVYLSSVKVTLTASDATSGVAHTYYTLDGGSLTTYSAAFTVTPLGSHTVQSYSVDNAGNIEATTTTNFTIATGVPAAMSTPAPNSTLTGSSVTFTWTAGTGVKQYELYVGNSGVGSSNIKTSGTLTTTSYTVTNIPTAGTTLNVRLLSLLGGTWQHVDYTYTEAKPTAPAVMSTPTPSSTLTGASVKFTWTAGTGVTEYSMHIGTTGVGSTNIATTGNLTTTSDTISNIPTTGGTLYVRLYSLISGAWQYIDYTYTEYTPPVPAAMSTPAPSSTLTGTSTTFTWTAGTGVTQYSLHVGTTGVGSTNIATSGSLTTTSYTVSGIPATGGLLYVRLYSLISGAWQYTDYTYTESTAAVKAAMSTPVPSSTLTGSSATFTWTAGTGVSQYTIHVGTTGAGSSNISAPGSLTTTTYNVTGIPTSGGTLYVRLYSLISGAWQYTDYTYTEQ